MTVTDAFAPFLPARRLARVTPSAIWKNLRLANQPGVISMAGGRPSPDSFPIEAIRRATELVLREHPREALQYASSAGYEPLRAWIVARMAAKGLAVDPSQVIVTTGSQQGLDLVAKLLVDPGSHVAVESPTYEGALQAFAPYEPEFIGVRCDGDGPLPDQLSSARGARFLYALPSFQNPSGRCMSDGRRQALVEAARAIDLPIVEDDPYGDLWFDTPPPASLASRWPEGTIHLGSFSKVLAPGLRLGYVVAPPAVASKLLLLKQATDLHTPELNQRVVHEVVRHGFLDAHLAAVRARYRAQRDVMQAALVAHLPDGCHWRAPGGGMFFWIELPAGIDAEALLPQAADSGFVYVPGRSFYAADARSDTLRLSFATASAEQIERGVALLGQLLDRAVRA